MTTKRTKRNGSKFRFESCHPDKFKALNFNKLGAFSVSEIRELAVELAVKNLVSKERLEPTYDYKKAKLVKSESDKGWYVLYYVWDVQKNALVRKRKFIPKNFKSDSSKESYARDLINKINSLLEEGYHINRVKARDEAENFSVHQELTIEEAVIKYIHVCTNVSKNCDSEIVQKRGAVDKFHNWINTKYGRVEYLSEITSIMTRKYVDKLIEDDGLAAKTCNNILGILRHFYSTALKRNWVDGKNPFAGIEKLKTSYGEKNIPFNDQQLRDVKEYILETNPYFWNFVGFIYYAFMRPSEIKKLKIKNIDFERRQIRIESWQSKVRKLDILPIAPGLMKCLENMELDKFNPDDYLFGAKKKPSKTMLGMNWTTKQFKKVKDHFGYDENYTLYGFKHTAVCRWYEKEKDIVRIQKMCRHSTIEMTARYLKSLGLLTDVYQVESLPEI